MATTTNFSIPKVDQGTVITASAMNAILDKIDLEMSQLMIYEKLVKTISVVKDVPSSRIPLTLPTTWHFCRIIYGTSMVNNEVKLTPSDWQAGFSFRQKEGSSYQYVNLTYSDGTYYVTNGFAVSLIFEFYQLVYKL